MKNVRKLLAIVMCILLIVPAVLPQEVTIAWAKETKCVVYEGDDFKVAFQIEAEWEKHYKAEITITNTGDETIKNWMLEYDSADQYEQIWNASVTAREDETYRIKNAGYNQDIQSGQSVSFGVIGSYEETPDIPDYYERLGALKEVKEDTYSVKPYIQSQWDTGCILELAIHNTSQQDIESWQMDFQCKALIQSLWNGTLQANGEDQYTVFSESHNQNIPAGGSVTIGMQLNWNDMEDSDMEDSEEESETGQSSQLMLDGTEAFKDTRKEVVVTTIQKEKREIFKVEEALWNGVVNRQTFHDGTVYEYQYDAQGNITKRTENRVFKASYEYNDKDQLVRENNTVENKTTVYQYDDGNNITNILEYPFTLEDSLEGQEVQKVHTYEYRDAWKDLLTEYDGQNIIYDEIGNPLSYRDGMDIRKTTCPHLWKWHRS